MNQFDIFNRQFLFKKKMSHMWFIVDSKKNDGNKKKKKSQSINKKTRKNKKQTQKHNLKREKKAKRELEVKNMQALGFEPRPPERLQPECSALDQLGHACFTFFR